MDQDRFLQDLTYTFSQYLITCFLKAVRREVNNLESSVAVQELELAKKSCFIRFLWILGNQYNVGTLS